MPRMWSSVDFPAPEGPMIDTNSPSLISALMRRSTYVRATPCGYDFSRFRNEISITRNRRSFGDGRHLHPLLDDTAVEEVDAAIGVARVARIVRDHADRGAAHVQLA